MTGALWRRAVAGGIALFVAITVAGCTSTEQAAGPSGVEDAPQTPTTQVTVPAAPDAVLTPEVDAAEEPAAPTDETTTEEPPPPPPLPLAEVFAEPEFGSTQVSPGEPIVLGVTDGIFSWVDMTNPEGESVAGTVSDDGAEWVLGEKLGFGRDYTVTGVAVNDDGARTVFTETFTTATTKEPITVSVSPGDGAVRGIAQPITVSFGIAAQDKALIERNVKVVTEPEVEGSWAWVQRAGFTYPTLDWRPKEYWPANTKVHVEANLYGVKFQDGWYGGSDVTVDFTIGRAQITYADAKKNEIRVVRDGKEVAKYHGSFGRGDESWVQDPNLVTRSGIHVVTNKDPVYKMNNPEYGYTDSTQYWAVRISNNGEFIHNNPGTTGWELQNVNKTHGCVNLSWDDAKEYYDSTLFGDPVEVTGTSIELSRADGDIWDWTVPWDEWLTMSALHPDSIFND